MAYTMKAETLAETLDKLCEMLIAKGAMAKADKQAALESVTNALNTSFPDGVPQDLFTDPAKQQNLIVSLVTAPILKNNPALQMDLSLFFKPDLQPAETKKLFKAFWMGMNKLEPDPNKRRSEKDIDAEADELLDLAAQQKLNKGPSPKPSNDDSESDELEETFQLLFGITRFGMPITVSLNKGNVGGIVDSYAASSLGGDSIHEGRGFGGDSTTNPYVTAMAKERLLDITGLGSAILADLKASHLIHSPPTYTPGSK